MAISVVRSQTIATPNVTSLTLTMGASPLSNDNLLVAAFSSRTGTPTPTLPGGWTAVFNGTGGFGSLSYSLFYKQASTGDTSITVSGMGGTDDHQLSYVEISGAALTPEASGQDTSLLSSNGTSVNPSAVATTANGIAIACACLETGLNIATPSWDSGFSVLQAGDTGNVGSVSLAQIIYSSTGTKNPTYSTTGSAGNMWGGIVLFAEAGGGGGPAAFPVALFQKDNPLIGF